MSFIPSIKMITGTGRPRVILKFPTASVIYTPTGGGTYSSTSVIESGTPTLLPPLQVNQLISAYVETSALETPTYAKITAINDTTNTITVDEWTNGTPSITVGACVAASGAAGNVNVGTHSYKIAFVINGVEVAAGTVSNVVTISTSAKKVNLTGIPVRPSWLYGTCSARKIYRTIAGDTGNWKLVGTISDNTTTTYEDNIADGSLGANAVTDTTIGGAFVVNGWVADLPRTQQNGLREIFTPFQLIHKVFRGRKLNKKYGYEYQAILDYSQFISADTLLLIQKHLSATEDDQLVLIPRADAPEFQYNVFIDQPIELAMLGNGEGHHKPVFSFAGNELVVNFPIRNGYGTGYSTLYGTCL